MEIEASFGVTNGYMCSSISNKYKCKEHQLFDSICIAVLSSDAAIKCKFLSSLLIWEEWTDAKNCANCDCDKTLYFTSLLCTVV